MDQKIQLSDSRAARDMLQELCTEVRTSDDKPKGKRSERDRRAHQACDDDNRSLMMAFGPAFGQSCSMR